MDLEDYNANNEEIKEKVGLPDDMFFNFEFSPYREDYLETFKFYTETLAANAHYGIEPAYIFFRNAFGINARAIYTHDCYLVGINMGTVNWLISNFKLNNTLITDSGITLFNQLAPYLDNPINVLMYQAGLHFTFYHELAHLVQKSNYLELALDENPAPVECFDIERHLLEIDADTFGALCLGSHIMQYADKIFGVNAPKPLIESIIVLFCVPIILYLLSFNGNSDEMYYKEKTHPHPAIRLTNFLMCMSHYCNSVLDRKDSGFTTNQGDIFLYAMHICEQVEESFFEDNIVTQYRINVTANRHQVVKYLQELIGLNEELETRAVAKWNIYNSID